MFSEISLKVRYSREQSFEELLKREDGETPPVEGGPARAPPLETLPTEEALRRAPVSERHRPKERYGGRQHQNEYQGMSAWEWR